MCCGIVPGNPLYIVMNNRSSAGSDLTCCVTCARIMVSLARRVWSPLCFATRTHRARSFGLVPCRARAGRPRIKTQVSRNLTSQRLCRCVHCFAERCVNRILNWRYDRRTVSNDELPCRWLEREQPAFEINLSFVSNFLARLGQAGFDICSENKPRILHLSSCCVVVSWACFV